MPVTVTELILAFLKEDLRRTAISYGLFICNGSPLFRNHRLAMNGPERAIYRNTRHALPYVIYWAWEGKKHYALYLTIAALSEDGFLRSHIVALALRLGHYFFLVSFKSVPMTLTAVALVAGPGFGCKQDLLAHPTWFCQGFDTEQLHPSLDLQCYCRRRLH